MNEFLITQAWIFALSAIIEVLLIIFLINVVTFFNKLEIVKVKKPKKTEKVLHKEGEYPFDYIEPQVWFDLNNLD